MRRDVNELMVDAQDLLDEGLQKCLRLTRELMRGLELKVADEVAYRLLTNTQLTEELTSVSRSLYNSMAQTLFELIGRLQPEDCVGNRPVNFYFWPGYHSVLIKQRIFVQQGDDDWNFGVGICGRPGSESSSYYDSCQARLYHYFVKPRNQSDITPVDIHRLFLKTATSNDADTLRRLVVVSTQPIPLGTESSSYVQLTDGTENWGAQLHSGGWAKMRLAKSAPQKTSDEEYLRFRHDVQRRMDSLWLHSAFCDFEPPWLSSFIDDLGSRPESRPLQLSLQSARADKTASDWGDRSEGRPLFSNWVLLSLSPWLDPRDLSLDGDDQVAATTRNPASITVGSAAFLSSIPLRPVYLAFAKHWVSEVYNAIRNAEMAMLIHNKQLRVKEAFAAGPYFAHEIKTVVDRALPTVQQAAGDNDEQAIKTRRFVLYSIRTLCALAYSYTNAAMFPNEYTVKDEANTLLDPLRDLRQKGVLLADLNTIAQETYESLRMPDGGTITFADPGSCDISADDVQHGACFLLIVELLRNYCRSPRSGPTAEFRTWLDDYNLMIELKGFTRAERKPTSMSFARLDRFLRVLGVGNATSEWYPEAKSFKATVRVNLETDSAAHDQFS